LRLDKTLFLERKKLASPWISIF